MKDDSFATAFIDDLFSKHYHDLRKFCWSLLLSEDAAEDCVQDVFLIAQEKAELLAGHPCPLKWLMRTAKNLARRRIRDEARRRKHLNIVAVSDEILQNIPDPHGVDDLFQISDAEIDKIAKVILSFITEDERELYELYYIQGLSTSETAERLGLTKSTVSMRLLRLRRKVKAYSENIFNE